MSKAAPTPTNQTFGKRFRRLIARISCFGVPNARKTIEAREATTASTISDISPGVGGDEIVGHVVSTT
jgi:hypothetical protein